MSQQDSGIDSEGQLLISEVKRLDYALSSIWADPQWSSLRPNRAPVNHLERKIVRIAVAAMRSYGKSTLLNALICRSLLYSSMQQSTSYPSYLSAGVKDFAETIYADGRRVGVPVSPEGIKAATAQFSSGRNINTATLGAERLNVELSHWPLPPNLELIDLAGFDDSYHDTEEAEAKLHKTDESPAFKRARVLRNNALVDADVVLFILKPVKFLGQIERAFLKDIFQTKGATGVLPVFSIVMSEQLDDSKSSLIQKKDKEFTHQRLSTARLAYGNFLNEIGIDITASWQPVVVSAKMALDRPDVDDFGLTALRNALTMIASGKRSAAVSARIFSAGLALRKSCDLLSYLLVDRIAYEQAVAKNEEISQQNRQEAENRMKHIQGNGEGIAMEICKKFEELACKAVEDWANSPGHWPQKVHRLNVALDAAAATAVAEIVEAVSEFYRDAFKDEEPGVNPGLFRELQRVCAPRAHQVQPHHIKTDLWEDLFGVSDARRRAIAEERKNDLDWEINASFRHWEGRVDDICRVLYVHLPEAEHIKISPVPPSKVNINSGELNLCFSRFLGATSWANEYFQKGFDASSA